MRPTGFAATALTIGVEISGVRDASNTENVEVPELPPNVVHLWQRRLQDSTAVVQSCVELLSPDERQKAQRYRVEKPRSDFILTRGTLRTLIGKYLGEPPASISFRYTEFGKPLLDGPVELQFNVSHTDGLALLAFAKGREVGVDVEKVRFEWDFKQLAERFFSTNERQTLGKLSVDELRPAFFRCWTRKEAYIKAKGEGLSLPLHQFDVSIEANEKRALIATRPDAAEANRWIISDVAMSPQYTAAVAVGEPLAAVRSRG